MPPEKIPNKPEKIVKALEDAFKDVSEETKDKYLPMICYEKEPEYM